MFWLLISRSITKLFICLTRWQWRRIQIIGTRWYVDLRIYDPCQVARLLDDVIMGFLQYTKNCGLHMRRECRERFPRHRLQRKPLVNNPVMHHGTCVMHVPWCMSRSLSRGIGKNVPGIPGACTTRNFTYLTRGPWENDFRTIDPLRGESTGLRWRVPSQTSSKDKQSSYQWI